MATPMEALASRRPFAFVADLSIQIKAFAASAVLVICLILLGAVAYVALDKSQKGLQTLSTTILPRQQAFAAVKDAIATAQMKTFRYVSWASNGVNDALLKALSGQVEQDLRAINADIRALAVRADLSEDQRSALEDLVTRWKDYESSVKDTLEVGSTDAPMATMMLGAADEKFMAVAGDFQKMSDSIVARTNAISTELSADAEQKKAILAIGAALGLLLSIVTSVLVSRSIVKPISSVTNAMQRLSSGDTDVEVGYRGRRDEIGRMVEAIAVFRRNAIEMRTMELESLEAEKRSFKEIAEARARLTDAIESISEGFSLYDADDRLVVFNSKYKTLYAAAVDAVVPGTTFEAILRTASSRAVFEEAADGFEAWLAQRLAQHRAVSSTHIQHRSNGRYIQISERKTAEGGVVAIYADITDLKERESELARLVNELQATTAELTRSTDQLASANAQVTALNAQLESENVRMGSELDVTRRLQLMLLPGAAELRAIAGLEIAGYMQPAVEVGGDYYDVLQHEGRVKISIGDVTGHGLESGVLMVMTQAIVRALLTSGETDHVRFLTVLNHALFGNVQRMGSDKNLTLCLLDYAAGEVKLSGQHEEMIVVRRDGAVERVNTIDLGFPIGLVDEIAEFVGQTTVRLQTGDGVVLYTDGITEAENMADEQYGVERLCEVVRRHWAHSAETIKEAVVTDVRRHIGQQTVYDDITLVVAKQR